MIRCMIARGITGQVSRTLERSRANGNRWYDISPLFKNRLTKKANAVKYVADVLSQSFDCIIPVEHGACTLAVTKGNERFLPINIMSSTRSKQELRYTYFMRHYESVQIIAGFEREVALEKTNPQLWHVTFEKVKQIEKQGLKSSSVVPGKEPHGIIKLSRNDLTQLIEKYWCNDHLLKSYDDIMQKTGENTSIAIRNGRVGETYLKSMFDKMKLDASFHDETQTAIDLMLKIQQDGKDIHVGIQVKYTSNTQKSYGVGGYIVACRRERRTVGPCHESDFDVLMVCVETNKSGHVDYVYCIPTSALITAGIVSSTKLNTHGKTSFILRPEMTEIQSNHKYLWLNKFKIDVRNLNEQNFPEISAQFKQLIELAAKEKNVGL